MKCLTGKAAIMILDSDCKESEGVRFAPTVILFFYLANIVSKSTANR